MFENDSLFWATHEVAQIQNSGVCRLLLSKRQEERVIKLWQRKEDRGASVAAFPRRMEALQSLRNRTPQNAVMEINVITS